MIATLALTVLWWSVFALWWMVACWQAAFAFAVGTVFGALGLLGLSGRKN